MEWIKLEDKFPEDGQKCLVYDNKFGEYCILTYNNYYKCWDTDDGDDFVYNVDDIVERNGKKMLVVTHWMPLPEIPTV